MTPAFGPDEPDFIEGFDPGSERTLAAWLRHASRTDQCIYILVSGVRVSNRWVTYPVLRDSVSSFGNFPKGALIPNNIIRRWTNDQRFIGAGAACLLSACW